MNSIPKGYKLVPVEPTEEMIEAGNGAAFVEMEHDSDLGSCGWISNSDEVMQAMLDAAPTPPQPIFDEAKERELFEAWALEAYGVSDDEELNMKNPAIKENLNGWLACAQSRANVVEVNHE